MKVPLVDLKAQYAAIKDEIDTAMRAIVENATFIMGEPVKRFDAAFAAYCTARHCIGTSSGTTALHLALLACDIRPGDEVITTPHTFIATTEAISHAGADPVFVDIDPATYTVDPEKIAKAVTPRTKAILPVHLYGHPADMDPIVEVARAHGLKVIEDAAQAHGAEYKGRRAGVLGDVAVFSFFPGKNLGAYGDSGALVTNDDDVAERARLLVNHGRKSKYEHLIEGYNYRPDALQSAILEVKLRHLDSWTEQRRAHAARYDRLLHGASLTTPVQAPWAKHVYHLYVVCVPDRDSILKRLQQDAIEAGIHYPIPLHLQPAYSRLGHREGDFPATEEAAGSVLSLPLYPEMTAEIVDFVAGSLRALL